MAAADPRLRRLYESNGAPPLWEREGGFATLVKIVLEQQVSLDSAAAAFRNLEAALGTVAPERFLTLDDAELKRIGFSRQKAGYCRGLAAGIIDGSVDLAALDGMDDAAARAALTAIRGIGPWTADVYLLFALRRPDVWPMGDRALVVSMAENLPLDEVPGYDEAAEIALAWGPWRSVAARMLWQAYLAARGRSLM
ncbi:MAG: DNA-3-methyladenine glycosylase 2 family protein [Acidimicrobiia bacterium]|nr:DNA-3-methyladenine glycosylase 2 family protein [Acidimicrobiia bacterium]